MRALSGVVLVLALLAPTARANELFAELARGVDVGDPTAVAAAEASLRAADPDFWESPLRPGPLRATLARRLPPPEVHALLDSANREGEDRAARVRHLIENLSPRPDLAGLLAERGGWQALLDDEGGHRVLADVARDGVLGGDVRLATALLADPRTTERAAGALSASPFAAGLCFLADAVTGQVDLPAEARARLAVFEPDLWNRYVTRSLGAERVQALSKAAASDPDPAMRVLAARLLLRSGDAAAFEATVAAYRDAASWRIDAQEWAEIGKWWWFTPAFGTDLPDDLWYDVVESTIYLSHVRASADPAGAESLAALLRAHLARPASPQRRGLALRLLEQVAYVFVFEEEGPARAVPSWEGLLADLEVSREGEPPALQALARRVAKRARRDLVTEETRREDRAPDAKPEEWASPVWALMPPAFAVTAEVSAADVRAWVDRDPAHLFDPDVNARVRSWSAALRRSVLELYPAAFLHAALVSPPDRYRIPGRARFARDARGAENRERLLRLLPDAPRHHPLLLAAVEIGDWPERNRVALGSALHALMPSAGLGALRERLTDDAVAAGFCWRALETPRGVEDLGLVADLVTGRAERADALALLLDGYEYGPPETLGPVREWPERAVPLDEGRRTALSATLVGSADPWRAWLAARILALGASPRNLAALLTPAGDRLAAGITRRSHPLGDLALHVRSLAHLDVGLGFLEDARVSATARVAFFGNLLEESFCRQALEEDDADRPREADAMRARLLGWVAEGAGGLDGDVPEGLLLLWAEFATTDDVDRPALEALRAAVRSLPTGGPRLRLEAKQAEIVAWVESLGEER